jgi:hypothetical protein
MAVLLDAEEATLLRRVHELETLSPINQDFIVSIIEREVDVERIVSLDMDNVHAAPNSARPKQVLVCDCLIEWTNGDIERTGIELRCTEETHTESVEHHDDGTMSIPISGMNTRYNYRTLDLAFF